MLRLTINGIDAELYQNAPVNIKLQYADVTKINNPQGSFTQTFRLPLTAHNRTIFGNIDEPSLVGGLDLKQRIAATLHSGSTPLSVGYVQIKSVYMTKEVYAEVEVAFFSGALDLKTELGGSFISDLDLSSYDHDLTLLALANSWTASSGIAPEIRYGLLDKGSNWSSENPINSSDGVPLPTFTPFIQAKVLVDKIITGAGFTYESTYLEGSDFADVYMPAWNGSSSVLPKDDRDENVRVTLAADQVVASGVNPIQFSESPAGCKDPSNNYSSAQYKYTTPFAGLFTIRLTLSWTVVGYPLTNGFIRFRYGSQTSSNIAFDSVSGTNLVFNINNARLSSGDEVFVEVFKTGSGSVTLEASNNFNEGRRTSLQVIAETALGDYEVGVAENLPEMKQIDYLTSLQKMYNLVFVPDPNKPNHLLIDTFENYQASGANKDWTNKIDYGKDVNIKPTTDLQSQVYEWSHKEGKDFISLEVQKSLDRVYGRQRIVESDNDFATGELVIQTGFAPYILSLIPQTDTPLFRGLSADGTGVQDPLPMLAYWCGTSSSYGTISIRDEDDDITPVAGIPFFSNYNSDDPQLTDNDLNFGVERPLYSIAVNPRDTLYIRFWAQYVTELYSSTARILTCSVRLNEADIADLQFNDQVYINDSFYRILSVSFDANEPSVAKAQLIKKLDDLAICADTPTSLLESSNIILFNGSSSGSPDYGSQGCCQLYGYRWAVDRVNGNRCRPNNAQLET